MSDDAHRWASFSSAFSIVLSLASDRIAELGCTPVGEDPKAFVDRGGLRRLETEAADGRGDRPRRHAEREDQNDRPRRYGRQNDAKYNNLYTTGVIPAKTYPGQDKDNAIAVVQNILVANAKMADKVAYDIVKTFIEKRDELAIVHAEAKNITLENQSLKNSPIPWHPGAVKYFAEQGVKM